MKETPRNSLLPWAAAAAAATILLTASPLNAWQASTSVPSEVQLRSKATQLLAAPGAGPGAEGKLSPWGFPQAAVPF